LTRRRSIEVSDKDAFSIALNDDFCRSLSCKSRVPRIVIIIGF
jgi:hypothetical protein